MNPLAGIVATLLCALACASAFGYGEPAGAAESGIRPQVYPGPRLSASLPAAVQITFAVAVRPDPGRGRLAGAEIVAPFSCLAVAWLVIGPLVRPHWRPNADNRTALSWSEIAASGVSLLFPVAALVVAYWVHERDDHNFLLLVTVIFFCAALPALLVCARVLRHATRTAPPTNLRDVVGPALLGFSAACFATLPSFWYASIESSAPALDVSTLEDLALQPDSGRAFLLLVALATFALLYACVVLATGAGIVNRNSAVLRRAAQHCRPELHRALELNPLGVLVIGTLFVVCIALPDLLGGDVRLTVFGPFASRVALLALTGTSLSAMVLLACSLGMARRISAVSRYLATARRQSSSEQTVCWPSDLHASRVFPPTPVVARAANAGACGRKLLWATDLTQWQLRVSEWLHHGHNEVSHRAAIFTLLATEMSLFRWCVLGTVFCALASVGAVYLFPIEADPLLLLNLLLLAGIGAVAALAATTFERDALLSNVLCNRPALRKFSVPLFVFISMPFIALALGLGLHA